jgi:hypothetical protein
MYGADLFLLVTEALLKSSPDLNTLEVNVVLTPPPGPSRWSVDRLLLLIVILRS